MKVKERYALYERQAPVLERIAQKYPEGSAENAALKQAAFALCFALTQRYDEFTKYVSDMTRPPTKAEEKRMNKHLKELGLD